MAPDFLWLCSRELSCLFWKWWVVLHGFMTGRQMLKWSVVRPQNPLCSFLHWVISLLHPGYFQAHFPAIHLCSVYSYQTFFISDLEEGLLRFPSFSPHFPRDAFYLKISFSGFIFMWRPYCSSICKSFTVASSFWVNWKAAKHIKCSEAVLVSNKAGDWLCWGKLPPTPDRAWSAY